MDGARGRRYGVRLVADVLYYHRLKNVRVFSNPLVTQEILGFTDFFSPNINNSSAVAEMGDRLATV